MTKAIHSFILCALLAFPCLGQIDLFKDYKLLNLGYISIPAMMEIQAGNYKKVSDALQSTIAKKFDYEVADNRVVFQQKGLNNLEQRGLSTYARVIVETELGNFGDYEKISTSLTITPAELSEISAEFKNQLQQSFQGTTLKLISWYGVALTRVNGRSALKISYLRQLADKPLVIVNMYRFQNNDRMHTVTASYRQSDEATWKTLMDKAVGSFTITNVR